MLGMEKQHASLLASKSKIMLLRHWQSPHRRWWRWMRKDCFLARLTRWWRMVPWALVNFALTMMGRGWILGVWSLVESQSRRNTRRGRGHEGSRSSGLVQQVENGTTLLDTCLLAYADVQHVSDSFINFASHGGMVHCGSSSTHRPNSSTFTNIKNPLSLEKSPPVGIGFSSSPEGEFCSEALDPEAIPNDSLALVMPTICKHPFDLALSENFHSLVNLKSISYHLTTGPSTSQLSNRPSFLNPNISPISREHHSHSTLYPGTSSSSHQSQPLLLSSILLRNPNQGYSSLVNSVKNALQATDHSGSDDLEDSYY